MPKQKKKGEYEILEKIKRRLKPKFMLKNQ